MLSLYAFLYIAEMTNINYILALGLQSISSIIELAVNTSFTLRNGFMQKGEEPFQCPNCQASIHQCYACKEEGSSNLNKLFGAETVAR